MTSSEKILELRKHNPELKAAEIARIIGLSRERVRQVLLSLELPTDLTRGEFGNVRLICDNCGKIFMRLGTMHRHRVKRGYRHTYCSKRCLGQVIGRTYGYGKSGSTNQSAEELNC